MSNIFMSLVLPITIFACAHDGPPQSKTDPVTTPTADYGAREWRLDDRTACVGDSIKFKFFTGNIRTGRLSPSGHPAELPIEGTSDAGIYKIPEIQWIECNGRLVYPPKPSR